MFSGRHVFFEKYVYIQNVEKKQVLNLLQFSWLQYENYLQRPNRFVNYSNY
jgi:hypothetical protein